ncbi:MAG: DUF11 domain-containing protein, partial [Saprospiraceae bacterium]|nr:DUF11 domain-containing protein [Saprospiraceae bacterium]
MSRLDFFYRLKRLPGFLWVRYNSVWIGSELQKYRIKIDDQTNLAGVLFIKRIAVFLLIVLTSFNLVSICAQPYPVTFYIPLPEGDIRNTLDGINSATGNDITTVISLVTIEGNAVLVYDHWEDGYEADINNPIQASTLVFGDNNPANGDLSTPPAGLSCFPICPAGDAPLSVGLILTFKNTMSAFPTRGNSPLFFDGKDRISSNRSLSLSRAAWSPTPGTVLAGAVEVVDTSAYGLCFVAPVGENTADQFSMFQRTDFYVMAAEDNTLVTIDVNGPTAGGGIMMMTLNQGQGYTVSNVLEGATIKATKPVQAHLITGDVGANYESRWFTLYPLDFADQTYYNPVASASTNDLTSVFLYNPTTNPLNVNYNTLSGSGSFMIPVMTSYRFDMPIGSGARFSGDGNFFAVAVVDSDAGGNLTHDWGLTLFPENYLTSSVVVGWGPGADDISGPAGPDANYSPVWVIAAQPTTIYVDWDGNPTTGALTDPNGKKYDQDFSVSAYQSLRLFDNVNNDNDQTGARIYTVDGTKIAAAWGQDPSVSVAGNPAFDLGTSISPSLVLESFKKAQLVDDDMDGLLDPGESIIYRVIVRNLSQRTVSMVTVEDMLPTDDVTYVVMSTTRYSSNPLFNNISVPDSGSTPFPLDEGGITLMHLEGGQTDTIEYEVSASFTMGIPDVVINNAMVNTGESIFNIDVEVPVDNSFNPCSVDFYTDNTFSSITFNYEPNNTLYLQVNIPYLINGGAVNLVLENTDNGDFETVTLTETPASSGIYQGSLTSSNSSGGGQENGILLAILGHSISATYTNTQYANTCSAMAIMTPPVQIKPLYLSDSLVGQGLDRTIPWDATAAITAELFPGGGPVIIGNTTSDEIEDDDNNFSVSHETMAGDGRLMLVGISYIDNATNSRQVNTVTYGPALQSLSRVGSIVRNADGTRPVTELWSLVDPDVGMGDLAVTWNEAHESKVVGVMTFNNVDQSTPLGNPSSATGDDPDDPSILISSAMDELVFDVVTWSNNWGLSAGPDQTEQWNLQVDPSGGSDDLTGAASTQSGASMVTMSWNEHRDPWAQIAVAIKPVAGNPTESFTQLPTMCQDFELIAGTTVTATLYLNILTGSMPATPSITGVLKANGSLIANLSNASFTGGILTLAGVVASDDTVSAGQAVSLEVTTAQAGVTFEIEYDVLNKPSRIDLPTTSVISIDALALYD